MPHAAIYRSAPEQPLRSEMRERVERRRGDQPPGKKLTPFPITVSERRAALRQPLRHAVAGSIWRSGEATPSRNAAPEDESADRQSAELAGLSVPAAAAVPTATEEEYYKHDDEKCRGGHVAS
jgi:hypothetical protein